MLIILSTRPCQYSSYAHLLCSESFNSLSDFNCEYLILFVLSSCLPRLFDKCCCVLPFLILQLNIFHVHLSYKIKKVLWLTINQQKPSIFLAVWKNSLINVSLFCHLVSWYCLTFKLHHEQSTFSENIFGLIDYSCIFYLNFSWNLLFMVDMEVYAKSTPFFISDISVTPYWD